MSFDITNDHSAGYWAAHVLGCGYFEGGSRSLGLKRNGQYVAAVIYECWNGKSVVCHIAADGRMTPAYIAAIFDYPFNVCCVSKIICPVSSDNSQCLKFVRSLGFTEEARLKDVTPDGDSVLFTMTREACRFIKERYGKKLTFATATA